MVFGLQEAATDAFNLLLERLDSLIEVIADLAAAVRESKEE